VAHGQLPERAAIVTITIDPSVPSTVYLIYNYPGPRVGIAKSTDGAASWSVIYDAPHDLVFPPIAIDPATPSTLYAGGPDGVRKSTNGGTDWEPAKDGLIDFDIRLLVSDPVNTAVVYTGGRDGVFKSDDRGETWSKLVSFQLPVPDWPSPLTQPPPFGAGPAHARSLLIDITNPNILYAGTFRPNGCAFSDKLLFKSVDGGETWSSSVSPPSSGCILGGLMAMDTANPSILYASAYNEGTGLLLKSTSGGTGWANIWARDTFLLSLAVAPSSTAVLYAGLGEASESPVNGVMKSIDGGTSWTDAGLIGNAVTVIAVAPSDPNTLYASTEGLSSEPRGFRGLFKSVDGGASWFAINNGLEGLIDSRFHIGALVINSKRPNVLYLGTAGAGVLRSTDAGATWHPFNEGLADLDVRALALTPGEQKTLLAGTPSGAFKITIDDAGGS
jgi:photosystem II stability/assembly factor-like uncharacterized protein